MDWSAVLAALVTGVITAAAAVLAVLITMRGERARLHEDRLWTERAAMYVELLAWANDVNVWALRRKPGPAEPLPARPPPLPRLLFARVLAFAGPIVRDHVETVDYELLVADEPPEYAVRLHVEADALQDAVQLDLQQMRDRSKREKDHMGIGQRSLQNLGQGHGPRPRPPDPPAR